MHQQSSINDAAVSIRDFIDANPLSKETPSQLAAQFHVSRKNVLPVFKELTGLTIRQYQFDSLMKAASEMLLSGMLIKEVAIECGYMDYKGNFSRSFKKVFEMGPDEWLHKKLIEKASSNADGQV